MKIRNLDLWGLRYTKDIFHKLQVNYNLSITLFLHLLSVSEKLAYNTIERQDKNKTIQGIKGS